MTRRRMAVSAVLVSVIVLAAVPAVAGDDWPQWCYDGAHTSVSPAKMTGGLKRLWSRELPAPNKAWPDTQYFMQFDKSYEPIAAEGKLFVPSNVTDSVTAYDLKTGREVWRFYGEAPVRFAPVYHNGPSTGSGQGKVLFVCDDGFLYCVKAADGTLIYKLRGGPDNRRGLGNGRLCSLWPARGGPTLEGGVLYWAASIWPFMGTFIYATDPDTGDVLWCNSGNGAAWNQQPHGGALAFSGISPQGYLAVADKTTLMVPNGRNLPGIFDRETGAIKFSQQYSKWGGTDLKVLWGGVYVSGRRHNTRNLGRGGGASGFLSDKNQILRCDGKTGSFVVLQQAFVKEADKRGRQRTVEKFTPIWEGTLDPPMHSVALKAADHAYGPGAKGTIVGVALKGGGKAEVDFVGTFEGTFWRALVADGKVIVVTLEGGLYCYGPGGGQAKAYKLEAAATPRRGDAKWSAQAKKILDRCDATGGWSVSLGVGSGGLIDAVLAQSKLKVIVIDRDAKKIDALRRRMQAMGLYGPRVTALVGDPFDYDLPPYLANLVFSEDVNAAGFDAAKHSVQRTLGPIRPYGGMAVLPGVPVAWAKTGDLDGATVSEADGAVVILRSGALPGAADWSHQYADAANTVVGADDRVKLPLGILWFGGNTHLDILPRHGHGPTPQVVGGRLIVEGIDSLSARDAYTGRVMWKKKYEGFSNFGMYWDRSFKADIYDRSYNQGHIPGANQWGANYVSTADAIYLINGPKMLVLDPATGDVTKTFRVPGGADPAVNWGVALIRGDVLIAAAEPLGIWGKIAKGQQPPPAKGTFRLEGVQGVSLNKKYAPCSRRLVAMDRKTGKVLWQRSAELAFRHNAIIASGDRVFVIDGLSGFQRLWLKMNGVPVPTGAVIGLDLKTGREIWRDAKHVFGTWLGYSAEHDVLIQGGSGSRDRAFDETTTGLVAYKGTDGKVAWKDLERRHTGPMMLHGRNIITNGGNGGEVFDLLTGELKPRKHPLTGENTPWRWERLYGCNTAIASKHMMLFRSGAAAYYDMNTIGGTGNFGGFKSGCTSNMVAADGILNIPDYTRTCTCAYQNQTSLAMVHMPDVETWTFDTLAAPGAEPIEKIGINLGAPGDRNQDGTLWLDVPSVGFKGPAVAVTLAPDGLTLSGPHPPAGKPRLFRMHSTQIAGPLSWVAASGAEGITEIKVTLAPGRGSASAYTVGLVFVDPDAEAAAGDRVFDVTVQGTRVVSGLDIAKAASGPRKVLVREFKNVKVKDVLTVSFKAVKGQPILCGLEATAQ